MNPVKQRETSTEQAFWYILKTKSNAEKVVHSRLHSLGYAAYLPLFTTIRVWSDRKKKIEVPLLPTYVFVQCLKTELSQIVRVQGAAWLVQDFGEPARVKEYEIENLRIFSQEKESILQQDLTDFSIGESVLVTHGNFQGLIGKMVHSKGEYRVMIEINCLHTSFFVNVPKSQITKISLS